MLLFESIKLAFNSIRASKLRSILTLLGIAVGLFSIIIVMTAISAIQNSIETTFNSIGTNNFIIQKWPAIQMGNPHRRRELRNRENLTVKQGEKLREITKLPVAIGISIGRGGRTIKFRNEKTNPNVSVAGVTYDYFMARDLKVVEGRNFTRSDDEGNKPYAVIGADIVNALFKNIDPIGQIIKVDNFNLEIIGVFEKKGSILGQSQDNFVCIPISVFEKYFGSERSASFIVMCKNKESISETMDEVIGALRKIRKVPAGQDNDFEIVTNEQLIEQFNDLTKYFKLGAAVVAFIALLAAGVGIMNIMLVSVTERTKEIGIRKAIGARKQNILTQFVIEAVSLSWFGGMIGIILGVIGGNVVAVALGVSVVVPIDWIVIGLLVTTFVGVAFGVYPAMKAANLDPIEALRYE
ncbi:ABC transporter permease [Stygiobacter electus]|uniref:ABC transporter permease n=1 Tax=Stygiobacter electus TaxID=3032292 RepID=A0AAE3TEI6_9BACT|nr:ABC transporter permease [Stygiobacter electus]MDF1612437.1 ABC transporter permease [Stygiobacter electus]